jgi:transcriptional regulator with XRE-family HTH domain
VQNIQPFIPDEEGCRLTAAPKGLSWMPQHFDLFEMVQMIIGDRLRALREERNLSQGHIQKRTGLLRCYISRLENDHTVPALETLEKMARALEMPLYQLFCDGPEQPQSPNAVKGKTTAQGLWGSSGKDARPLSKLQQLLGRISENDRKLLMLLAQKLAGASKRKSRNLCRAL